MADDEEFLRLDTIGHGAAVELFDIELQRVLENIADPNTDPKKVRSITLRVSFSPSENREGAAHRVECVSKLAAVKPAAGMLFFGKKGTRRVAVEHNPKQGKLFDPEEKKPAGPPALRAVASEG